VDVLGRCGELADPDAVTAWVGHHVDSEQGYPVSCRLYDVGMCRNIRPLYNFDPPATQGEVHSAALQYVRKISGSTKPSQINADAFERAVDAIADISMRLLNELVTSAPPKDRETEAVKARARAAARFTA
jgi:hypothetical protein